jgi:hypothetical protein
VFSALPGYGCPIKKALTFQLKIFQKNKKNKGSVVAVL